MESRKHLAEAKKSAGTHNCTQSVLCTYYDYTPLDEETIKQAGNCFAVGMGNMEGTCGALVGAGIVYGLAVKDKAKGVKGMRQMMTKFQQRNGAMQVAQGRWHGQGLARVSALCGRCVGVSGGIVGRNKIACGIP